MDRKKNMLVTTDTDLWNSADEAHFFVVKGTVKPLPEVTTPIIEDALVQGLLREATEEEISKYNYQQEIETAVNERKIKAGKNYEETVKNYLKYKQRTEEKKMPNLDNEVEEEAKAVEESKKEEEAPKEEETKEEEAPKEEEKKKEEKKK